MFKIYIIALLIWSLPGGNSYANERPVVDDNGTIHVPAFSLPESSFLSPESRAALKRQRDIHHPEVMRSRKACPPLEGADRADIPAIRQCRADHFYKTTAYKNLRKIYPVHLNIETIGGVYTEIFTPVDGIAPLNRDRVLINLHPGAYMWGGRTTSHQESVPIAALGKIKVVSVDYRMGPEYIYPAASEDVAAVYRALLKQYKPENIGLYGSSGGAMLVAQSIAWFLKEGLPLPAAIAMIGSGAPTAYDTERYKWPKSDSGYMTEAISGRNWENLFGAPHKYFKGVKRGDVLDSPGSYDAIMAQFPPTLLMNGGSRDFSLSMVIVTHAQLVRLGVETALHLWEGMGHCFHLNAEFPESRESYAVLVRFFDQHLGL